MTRESNTVLRCATSPGNLMAEEHALDALHEYMLSGMLGSPDGKILSCYRFHVSDEFFSWMVGLEDANAIGETFDRYIVHINRATRQILPPIQVALLTESLAEAVLVATGQHLRDSFKFKDGALSIAYKVSVHEDPAMQYVVQLRPYGNVTAMCRLMCLISSVINLKLAPLPAVYPIPGEEEIEKATGRGRLISQLIRGPIANTVYPQMPHQDKLAFVRRMALAFQAIWSIPLPTKPLIGELRAIETEDGLIFNVGPDTRFSQGGPFTTVRDYLRKYILSSLEFFKRQRGIDEFRARYLRRLGDFIDEGGLHEIPPIVDDVPVVAVHADMGPHNIIMTPGATVDLNAIIDWQLVFSLPYAAVHPVIEMYFRKAAPNGFGPEYDGAEELREAFWNAIPKWKEHDESEATRTFMEWYSFGLYMKADPSPYHFSADEKESFWAENIRVMEEFLEKHEDHWFAQV